MEPTHYDLTVILGVSFAIQLGGLFGIGWMAWRLGRMVQEAQRLTRAVAGLVVQEEEKTRDLLRQARG